MNLPNKLSLARIILVPFILLFMLPIHIGSFAPEGWNNFVCENGMIVAAILFVVASLTDLLDGKIARKYNLITNLGKFLDSLRREESLRSMDLNLPVRQLLHFMLLPSPRSRAVQQLLLMLSMLLILYMQPRSVLISMN